MKIAILSALVLSLHLATALAQTDVPAVQERLKERGFYFGEIDGRWGRETGAAVSRFQIRSGLEITGRLDAETLKALGLSDGKPPSGADQPAPDTWAALAEEDERFLNNLASRPPTQPATPAPPVKPSVPPAPLARIPGATPPAPSEQPPAPDGNFRTRERLRDWVAAFVLAGLEPTVDSELQFFAENGVDYFGKGPVDRESIRRDLRRYNERYPRRRFWLAGDPEIVSETADRLVVNFPLRYEVSGSGGEKSGKTLKTLELRKQDRRLAIVGVNEKPL